MAEIRELLDTLDITTGRLRVLHVTNSGQRFQTLVPVDQIEDEVERRKLDGNVWVSVSTFGDKDNGEAGNVTAVHAISIDLDAKPDGMGSMEGCRQLGAIVAQLLGVMPMALVFSGHGIQAHWAIDDADASWEPGDEATRARWVDLFRRFGLLVQKIAIEHGGKVDSAFGIERIWRCPGTLNQKKGQQPVLAQIQWKNSEYAALTYDEIDGVIRAHLGDEPISTTQTVDSVGEYESFPEKLKRRVDKWLEGTVAGIANDLQSLAADARDGWDNNATRKAFRLVELAESPWCPLTFDAARQILLDNMPTDSGFRKEKVAKKFEQALKRQNVGRGAPAPSFIAEELAKPAEVEDDLMRLGPPLDEEQPATAAVPAPKANGREDLHVDNAAKMADWLRDNMGTGKLAGIFNRSGEMVYTPLVGEIGYIEMTKRDTDYDGLAQVRPLTSSVLQARVQYTYDCYGLFKDEDNPKKKIRQPAVFPLSAAVIATSAIDMMPHLRVLAGVTHSPTVRSDGSLLDQPGYDPITKLLFLPENGRRVDDVPEHPTDEDVAKATKLLQYMVQDFKFVSEADRANYFGLLLTPLLRNIAPSPYKLGVIEAHQPGSGKTFLARAMISIHGGIFRSEFPYEDVELSKQVTSILDVTTGPVVVFDNASGTIKSSVLAGLLTTPYWSDRRLGTGRTFTGRNDRLWCVTGNNLVISGDLERRAMRVRIDPGVPNPQERTGFAISDFEGWVREQRTDLLWALLVWIRHWVASGMPVAQVEASDSFARWSQVVNGILRQAGIEGTFDSKETAAESMGSEDDEWEEFLRAIWEVKGDSRWTAAEILNLINDGAEIVGVPTTTPIPYEALPTELVAKRRGGEPLTKLSKSLGRWLRNRAGRYAGDLSIVIDSKTSANIYWKLRKYMPVS